MESAMLGGRTLPPSAKALILDPFTTTHGLNETFSDPLCGNGLVFKTLLSRSKTSTNTFTAGVATCAKGSSGLNAHRHEHAELYFFLEGSGLVEINGVQTAVQHGSLVFVPGNAQHRVSNLSDTNDLRWLYVFAADDFDDIKYRWTHLQTE
jgi:mannose-6-phosphate isomerase-like protein (cupin superfamily)